jgi:hypothetical protein
MKLFNQTILVFLTALFLQACQLGDEEDTDADEVEIQYLIVDDVVGKTLTGDDGPYELVLQANGNLVTLEDDVTKITVKGDTNTITIDSDTAIDSISITGDENTIEVKSGIDLTITDLKVLGNANDITVFDIVNDPIVNSSPDSVPNNICQTNSPDCS